MKTLEFEAEVSEERTLEIPLAFAPQVQPHQTVRVVLHLGGEQAPSVHDQKRAALMASFGAWKDDPTISEVFAEIDRQRHRIDRP